MGEFSILKKRDLSVFSLRISIRFVLRFAVLLFLKILWPNLHVVVGLLFQFSWCDQTDSNRQAEATDFKSVVFTIFTMVATQLNWPARKDSNLRPTV